MNRLGLGRWLGLAALASAVACGGHSVREVPGGAAGTSSTLHPTPMKPMPVDDPEPVGDPEPDDPVPMDLPGQLVGTLPVPCMYETLAALCAGGGGCPTSLDAFADSCAAGLSVDKARTSCGGTVVVVGQSFATSSWYFDASGALTGAISAGDVQELCADGHASNARVYGSVCPAITRLENACATDACGPLHMCNRGPDCPHHAADALSSYCSDPSTVSLSASPSTCGGHIVTVQRQNDQIRYCFDSEDWLTGIATQLPDASWSLIGTDCRIQGARTYPCLPE